MCGSDADNYCDKCDVPYCDDCSCQCNDAPGELVEAAREMLGSVADLEGTPIDYRVGKALAESCKRLRRALAAQGGK
jgi:hypothetical protein